MQSANNNKNKINLKCDEVSPHLSVCQYTLKGTLTLHMGPVSYTFMMKFTKT